MRKKFSPGDAVHIMGRASAVVVEVRPDSGEYICTCGCGNVRVAEGFLVDYSVSLEESDAFAALLSASAARGEVFGEMPPTREEFLSYLARS